MEKLRLVLPHWRAHNRSHGAEFETWAAAARAEGGERVAALLDRAAANMTETDNILRLAADEIGEPVNPVVHAHTHQHSHRPISGADD